MNTWLNRQNKKHRCLFKQDGRTELKDDMVSWLDSLIFQRSESLNGRVSKLAPRRGKHQPSPWPTDLPEDIARMLEGE